MARGGRALRRGLRRLGWQVSAGRGFLGRVGFLFGIGRGGEGEIWGLLTSGAWPFRRCVPRSLEGSRHLGVRINFHMRRPGASQRRANSVASVDLMRFQIKSTLAPARSVGVLPDYKNGRMKGENEDLWNAGFL